MVGVPIPVAALSKVWFCGRSLAGVEGPNPAGGGGGAWTSVSCECCVLPGRRLCVGLITRPEESCRTWCVIAQPRYWGGPGPLGAVEAREENGTGFLQASPATTCAILTKYLSQRRNVYGKICRGKRNTHFVEYKLGNLSVFEAFK